MLPPQRRIPDPWPNPNEVGFQQTSSLPFLQTAVGEHMARSPFQHLLYQQLSLQQSQGAEKSKGTSRTVDTHQETTKNMSTG